MAKKAAPKAAEAQSAATAHKVPTPKTAGTKSGPAASKKSSPKADGTQKTSAASADKAAAPRPRAATKKEVYEKLAEKTGLTRKDIAAVFATLGELVGTELGTRSTGLKVEALRRCPRRP